MKLFVDEKRQYPRVKVSLPIQFRLLSEREYEQIKDEFIRYPTMERRKSPLKTSELTGGLEGGEKLRNLDVVILQTLNLINQKLDLILEHLNLNPVASIAHFKAESIEISGSGMRFVSDNRLSHRDKIELSFELPATQIPTRRSLSPLTHSAFSLKANTHQIDALAEVVKSASEESKFILQQSESANAAKRHFTAVEFCAINEIDRDNITRYCAERQQLLSKNRLF